MATGKWVNRVFVATSTVAGKGVFAREDIREGELVEECGVFPFPNTLRIDRFWDHQMAWTDDHDVMAAGYAVMYNHSESPNICIERYVDENMMRVFAKRDIKAGEELFCHYCCEPWWEKKSGR